MWKLLRNVALAAIFVAGALKLLAWHAAGQDAQRLVAALKPFAELRYDSVSAGLDGSVTLGSVSVAIKRDKSAETYTAERVVLAPGAWWLFKSALFGGDSVPVQFDADVDGLKLPATAPLDPQWFNLVTLAPFEAAGCGATAFGSADYRKLDIAPQAAHEHAQYRYDADAKTLDVTLTLTAPNASDVTLETELHGFEPSMLRSADALAKLHMEQLSLDYADNGYLKRRNQFCAQRRSLAPAQFVEQHVGAVQDLLHQRGIEASADVIKLYRRLVENGGSVSLLSLPGGNFAAGDWFTSLPDDLLRQLKVTARYGDAPPVMFRLTFPAPREPPLVAETSATATTISSAIPTPTTSQPTTATDVSPKSATPPAVPAITLTSATVEPKPIVSATAVSAPATAPAALPPPASLPPTKPVATATAAPATGKSSDVKAVSSALKPSYGVGGLDEVDRAEAKLATPVKSATKPAIEAPLVPSEPAPANDGSTLALVWKPTMERLPESEPGSARSNYEAIDYARLKSQQGRYVRLITAGGKKVEGYLVSADDSDVQLRFSSSGGDVLFTVPKARIQQIQMWHAQPPG